MQSHEYSYTLLTSQCTRSDFWECSTHAVFMAAALGRPPLGLASSWCGGSVLGAPQLSFAANCAFADVTCNRVP